MCDTQTCSCSCNSCECSGPKFVFACSGAGDTGELADHAARAISREGHAMMFCLAGIGGRVDSILQMTQMASEILVIDGCSQSCAKKCLEESGFDEFKYLSLSDIGFKKGNTEVSEENINIVVKKAIEMLGCQ